MEFGDLYLSWGDLGISVLLLLYLVAGLGLGSIRSVLGLVRVLLLALSLSLLADLAADRAVASLGLPLFASYAAGLLLITGAVWVVMWIVTIGLKPAIHAMSTGIADNLFGALLGLARGFVMIMILLALSAHLPAGLVAGLWDRSLLLPKFGSASQAFWQVMPVTEDGFGALIVRLDYDENFIPRPAGDEEDPAEFDSEFLQRLNGVTDEQSKQGEQLEQLQQ